MLYIVVALKTEAQAFIDKYKLKKESLNNYTLFKNHNIKLIISGIGVDKAMFATQTLINHYDIVDEDIYLNVGVCGANNTFKIGELLNIGTINYNEKPYSLHNSSPLTIQCIDYEADTQIADIVDMESFGFYDAIRHSPAIKNFYILKIVSDHFEPKSLTKDMVKSLIFNQIDAINSLLQTKE